MATEAVCDDERLVVPADMISHCRDCNERLLGTKISGESAVSDSGACLT